MIGVPPTFLIIDYLLNIFSYSNTSFWMSTLHGFLNLLVPFSVMAGSFGLAWSLRRVRYLFIHENGIRLLQRRKETKILYSQLKQFSFKKTRMYNGDLFHGVSFEMELKANSSDSIQWQSHRSTIRPSGDSTNYDLLNHHLSRIVATSIEERIERGQKVTWGRSAFIHKTGIEINKNTGMFSSETIFVPWLDIKGIQFLDGQLLLAIGQHQPWNAVLRCDEANVLPGYLVIKRLLNKLSASAAIDFQSDSEISTAIADEHTYPETSNTVG